MKDQQLATGQRMMSASRKDDCVIKVTQDNEQQRIIIDALNSAAEALLGYTSNELDGSNLQLLLPEEVIEELQEELEFEAGGRDLAFVLRGFNRLTLKNKNGDIVPVSLHVFYVLSPDQNLHYELLIRDATVQYALHLMYQQLYQRGKDVVLEDAATGLHNKEYILETIDTIKPFIPIRGIQAVLGVMYIEDFQFLENKYSPEHVAGLVKSIAEEFKARCREEDMVGYLGQGRLGAILFDCSIEDGSNAFRRIHSGMVSQAYNVAEKPEPIQISIAYQLITENQAAEVLLQQCSDQSAALAQEGGNHVKRVGG